MSGEPTTPPAWAVKLALRLARGSTSKTVRDVAELLAPREPDAQADKPDPPRRVVVRVVR